MREGGVIWEKKALEQKRKFLERTSDTNSDFASQNDKESDDFVPQNDEEFDDFIPKKSKQEKEISDDTSEISWDLFSQEIDTTKIIYELF